MFVTMEKIIMETDVMRVAFLERFFRGLKCGRIKCTYYIDPFKTHDNNVSLFLPIDVLKTYLCNNAVRVKANLVIILFYLIYLIS